MIATDSDHSKNNFRTKLEVKVKPLQLLKANISFACLQFLNAFFAS